MEHWIQYHSPEVMKYGIDEVEGPPFYILSDKAILAPTETIIWLVGRRAAIDNGIYLSGWYTPEGVHAAPSNTGFFYEYPCELAGDCDPMPDIKTQDWYPDLLKLTKSFHSGLTRISNKKIRDGLLALAIAYGAPAPS